MSNEMEADEEPSTEATTISDLYNGFRVFERRNQAPPVVPSDSHTVLFELPLPDDPNVPPVPRVGEDKWNDDFVKLPNSPENKYLEIDEDGNKIKQPRWNLIKTTLSETPIKTSRDFEEAVKVYNSKKAQSWNFKALHELFDEEFTEEDSDYFFSNVLPKIIELALRLPELIQHPIPLLQQKMNHSISLSQEQCGCLLANAFLCTFPCRNVDRKNTDFPEINFDRLFSLKCDQVIEKIKCILNYFKRICYKKMPTGVLTFQRRYIDRESSCPNWKESGAKFSSIKLFVSAEGTIEDGTAMLQTDFANRYLGGGVLGWGCVQEEIRFVIYPEMILGMLFCQSMNSTESILMTGCEQYNKHSGYASSFKWAGNKNDVTEQDEFRRKMIYVTAIDAISFQKPYMQFQENLLKRELNKAHVGFFHDLNDELSPIPVSSGNWGCGAFRGSKPLKALLQLMVCCLNRRNLAYFTFGEEDLKTEIDAMFRWLCENDLTIGMLWKYLQEFRENKLTNQPEKLYKFIKRAHLRAMEVQSAVNDLKFSDEDSLENIGEDSNDKRKIDEDKCESSGDEKRENSHVSKKVKIDEDSGEVLKANESSEDTVEMEIDGKNKDENVNDKEDSKEELKLEKIDENLENHAAMSQEVDLFDIKEKESNEAINSQKLSSSVQDSSINVQDSPGNVSEDLFENLSQEEPSSDPEMLKETSGTHDCSITDIDKLPQSSDFQNTSDVIENTSATSTNLSNTIKSIENPPKTAELPSKQPKIKITDFFKRKT